MAEIFMSYEMLDPLSNMIFSKLFVGMLLPGDKIILLVGR